MSASRRGQSSKANKSTATDTRIQKDNDDGLQHEITELWEGPDGVIKNVEWLRIKAAGGKPKEQSNSDRSSGSKNASSAHRIDNDRQSDPEKRNVSLNDVLGFLGDKPRDTKHAKSHGQVRKTITNILKCIDKIGGPVAGAASVAFAPAPTVFSAFSFLVQFWTQHEAMLGNLDELLERCYGFLGRLHVYTDSMTPKLKHVVYKVIRHVVKVCRYSVEIKLSKWKTWSSLLKDGFLGESYVKALMDEMEKFVQEEQELLAASSFSQIAQLAKAIADEKEQDEIQRKVAADAKLWKETISKSLWQDGEGLDPKPVWKNSLKSISEKLINGTGEWIRENARFKTWADPGEHCSDSVLVLQGSKHSGKTCLVANIIKQFQAIEARPILAYFFHQPESRQPLSTTKLKALVSRSLLWQIATSSAALTRAMARASARMGYNPDDVDIWRQLFLDIDPEDKAAMNIYIVVDGIDNVLEFFIPLIRAVTAELSVNVRVFLTANDSVVNDSTKESLPLKAIKVHGQERSNMSDIAKFVSEQLDSMDALKKTDLPGVKECRKNIHEKLGERTGGDYLWISTILNSLRNVDRTSYINAILDDIKGSRAKQLEDEIKRLDKELTAEAIHELNEIIIWVVAAKELPKLNEVDAVLFLKFGSGGSLLPLQRRLDPLLEVNPAGRVSFRSKKLQKTHFDINSTKTKREVSKASKSAETQANVELVHRFLEHVCPMKSYDKARLETVLWGGDMTLIDSRPFIHYDNVSSHIRIAITCLEALVSKQSEPTDNLRMYAGEALIHHLKESSPRGGGELVEQVRTLLLELFTSENGIDALFWTRAEAMSQHAWSDSEGKWLQRNRAAWLYTTDGIDELNRWFRNLSVKYSVQKEKQNEMLQAIVKEGKIRHEILLKPAAKRLARHLLLEDIFTSREERTAVYFLHNYVQRVNEKDGPQKQAYVYDDSDSLTMKELLNIEEWALSESIVGEQDEQQAMWQIQTAMTMSSMCMGNQEDIDKERNRRIVKARTLDPNNLLASHTRAHQLKTPQNTDESREDILENAAEQIAKKDLSWCQNSISRSILAASIYLDLGGLLWEGAKFHAASEAFEKSLAYNSTRYSEYLAILKQYEEKEAQQDTMQFIGALNAKIKAAPNPHYLDRLIHEFVADSSFQRIVLQASEKHDGWESIKKTFDLVIDMAQASPVYLFYARKAYVSLLQVTSNQRVRLEEITVQCRLALESGIPQAESGSGVSYRDLFVIVDLLAHIYLDGAVAQIGQSDNKTERQTTSAGSGSFPQTLAKLNYAREIALLEQDTDIWLNANVNRCLAYYHTHNGDSQAASRAVAKIMAAASGLLDDDDPSNDWFAFYHLARALHSLHDWESSWAAWTMLSVLKPEDDENLLTCHACGEGIQLIDGDRLCKDCYGPVWLHEKCDPSSPPKAVFGPSCAKHHTFMTLRRDSKQMQAARNSKLLTEGKELSLLDWKAHLTTRYGLEIVKVSAKESHAPLSLPLSLVEVPDELPSEARVSSRRAPTSMRTIQIQPVGRKSGRGGKGRGGKAERSPKRQVPMSTRSLGPINERG